MTRPQRKIIYLVTADWYFALHHLPLAVAAREAGYDVVIATTVEKHGDIIRDAGLRVIPLAFSRSGINPLREATCVARIAALYRREKPNLVHHLALKPVIYGSAAARLAGVTAIVNGIMGLGYVFTATTADAMMLRMPMRAALAAALRSDGCRVVVQNRDDFTEMLDRGLTRPELLRLVRGVGVDTERFHPQPVPEGPPLVVLPARLLRDKGIYEFVAAARALKANGTIDARFALVGDPDPSNPASVKPDDLKAWIAEQVIEHWGWRTDMPDVYRQATLVCLPSYREGLPTSLLEAAASGRAIVTTDMPGCREVVQEGSNGWLVPSRDSNALARAFDDALSNGARRAAYAAAGRQMALSEFAKEIVFKKMLGIYEEVLERDRA